MRRKLPVLTLLLLLSTALLKAQSTYRNTGVGGTVYVGSAAGILSVNFDNFRLGTATSLVPHLPILAVLATVLTRLPWLAVLVKNKL